MTLPFLGTNHKVKIYFDKIYIHFELLQEDVWTNFIYSFIYLFI
jgi:hypothetical protein